MVKEISDDMIVAAAHGDEERIRLVRSLGMRSYMIVPLTAHGRTFGALTLATAESGRIYSDDDFRFAQDVAFRAALAVDNARAYDEAQTANRLKDEFLATLSHELRTPLNAILGYSRLLQSGMMTPDKHAHALQTVERNATALTQIVGDILDVSRIISGKIRLNVQAVDLPRVVSDAVETVLPAADAKQIRVQTILDPRAAPISGDPDRLQQIVWNLLSNAVKFTPKHGRRPGAAGARQFARGDRRQRQRHRHRAGFPPAHLRALPPGRQRHDPGARRHRSRSRHRAASRRTARRDDSCGERRT